MEKLFYSKKPRSFSMDRRSPKASKLKASVSKKLFQFLGNYTDDVLAEYIVVLVCNGKHQNQARDDLEAFLGDESGKFVAWLWDHLSEETDMPKAQAGSSDLKAEVTSGQNDNAKTDHETSRITDHPTQSAGISDIPLSKDVRYESSTFSSNLDPSNAIEDQESFQRWCPGLDAPSIEVNTEGTQSPMHGFQKNSGATDDCCNGAGKYISSRATWPSEISASGEQCLQYENQYQKIAKRNSSECPSRPLHIPKVEPVTRNLQSVITENPESRHLSMTKADERRLHSTAMDGVPHQITRPRGNVWDRLGKPCEEDDRMMREEKFQHGLDAIRREKTDHNGEELHKSRLMWVVPGARLKRSLIGELAVLDNSSGKVISNNHSQEYTIQEHNVHIVGTLDRAGNSGWKRQFNEIDSGNSSASFSGSKHNHLQNKEAFLSLQQPTPVKRRPSQILNEVTSEAKSSATLFPGAEFHSLKSANVSSNPRAGTMSQPQLHRKISVTTPMQNVVPVSSSMGAEKSEFLSSAECGKVNHQPVQDEVLDVKLRLRQVEMDMLKLRSNQAAVSNDAKPDATSSSGVQNHSEEDIESRTVLVTNVHFAASKEALLSHFTKCGVVAKVILLTDTITAQPKGAAYIVFASKDSVEKAILLSGTSFFSRTLTVMRKADMPSGFLAPSQPAGKPLQPWYPKPHRKSSFQKHYASSHLQWRRDQPASGENSSSATTRGLEASYTGE